MKLFCSATQGIALLLILALLAVPAVAQDDPSMNDLPPGEQNANRVKKLVIGEWTIDIERSVRENPDNEGLSPEELNAQIEQGKMMAGMVTIEITTEAMTILMGEMRMESPWKILSVEGNTTEAEVNANGEIRNQKVEVIDDNTLRMHVQGQMLIVIRKGAAPRVGGTETTPEPYTGPAPEGIHRMMIGEWKVDLAKTLRADPSMKDVSEADFAAALAFAEMAAGDMKLVVRPDRMDAHRMGAVEKYAYTVQSVDGNKVKISMTGPDGAVKEAIFTVEPTKMNGAVGGRPMFLTRDRAPEAASDAVTPGATGDSLRGVWVVDIDATVNKDPRFKDLADERKKMIAQGLQGMLGVITWTFTNDRFIEDTPAGKRDYAYKVVKIEGNAITIEMSDDAGNSAQTTLTVAGGKLSGDIHGSMRWLKRKP